MANDLSNGTYNELDASNNSAPPNGAPENMLPSAVDDTMRTLMGAAKRFWDRINGTQTAGGTANALTLTYATAPTAYTTGEAYTFKAAAANTSAATLNVNGLGAVDLYKPGPTGPTPLAGGEIQAGQMVTAVYDGTEFVITSMLASVIPSGTLAPYAGSAAPAGWLLCAGQAVSRTTYAALFAAIGTQFGTGDGSTTFNVPDLRGRVVAGLDNMNGSDAARLSDANSNIAAVRTTLGGAGGEVTHALSTNEMPSHAHGVNDPTHAHAQYANTQYLDTGNPGGSYGVGPNGNQSRGGTTQNAATGITLSNTGGGATHNNMQPTLLLNYLIKA